MVNIKDRATVCTFTPDKADRITSHSNCVMFGSEYYEKDVCCYCDHYGNLYTLEF